MAALRPEAPGAEPATDSFADRVYGQLKSMAMQYRFRPGERLNEVEIAKQLGVSRTPLREALNRLETEGFLTSTLGKGFYCREIDPKEIYDLYELRKAVEISAVRLSIERAQPDAIGALRSFLNETGPESGKRSTAELIALDETFHEQLMMMSGNAEMLRVLRNVNARIQFVRWIDMERDSASRRPATQREHRLILDALEAHDEKTCVERLERHITRRLDQITSAIASSLSQIYLRHGQF